MIPVYPLFALGFAVFLVLLNLALNRWKFEPRGFFFILGYQLATGLPVAYAVMFRGSFDTFAYALVAAILALPFIANEIRLMAKGRGPRLRSVLGILGLSVMLSIPFLSAAALPYALGLGLIAMCGFLAFHFRYPSLNPMWLRALIVDAAKEVRRGCRYSPKPVTVLIENPGNLLSGAFGCAVYLRKDRTIIWMKRKFHEELGRPNMDALARLIAERLRVESGKKRRAG